jgi:hypothetical protein
MTAFHWLGLGALVWAFVGLGFGAYVASQNGRPEGEGMIFGALFGPIGLLIVATLPPKQEKTAAPAAAPVYEFKPRKMLGEVGDGRSLRKTN